MSVDNSRYSVNNFVMQKKLIRWFLMLVVLPGCAVLHHVQVGQVDDRNDQAWVPFQVMVSETGISTEEIGKIAKATHSKGGDQMGDAAAIISLFQIGPRTGNMIYDEHYAERLLYLIYKECPTGQVTGLMSIREMRKYPVISGEIVKVTGFCKKTKTAAPAEVSMVGEY